MRYFGMVAIVLILMGCDSADEKIIKRTTLSVAEQLKDPDSAKFSNVYIVKGDHENSDSKTTWQSVAICGSVNGKNSFGAYAGQTRFVVTGRIYPNENQYIATNVTLENQESRQATVDTNKTEKPESIFEKIFWNVLCIDEKHQKSFTGDSW
ncbi:hypothetical protein IG611_15375 [Pectobacterium sp. A535-S3-A17]|uniref:hypothetical protein n=1 Tax=Pectobacterium quasiaquaticum TaxID=2774015 RepID=UPI0018754BB9|nr:hypothetical protein [Pectobacterium quasiaquaticum]MBE5226725.1 hypothetical protein [Pectobacterium quasiaquaticum]